MSTGTRHTIELPHVDGSFERYTLHAPPGFVRPAVPLTSRIFFAATHVVCDPFAEPDGSGRARVDWDATLAFRHHVWSWGLGVADAMDTAQRGMGLDWVATAELIRRCGIEARAVHGRLACGAGTDQLAPGPASLNAIVDAYIEQCGVVEGAGAQVVLMASRALAANASGPDDYLSVYETVLRHVDGPVILHWLGEMFDPQLGGYWGSARIETAMDVVLALIQSNAAKIEGIKVSLLDAAHEVAMRSRLPDGVRLFTGDDFNYPSLILGDAGRSSDALLGIFDPIAPAASVALSALDAGDAKRFEETLLPTLPLARHVFAAPTYYYKTGIVFLAYLNGHQEHFRMVGGLESARSVLHLAETFRLADRAGLLTNPELAAGRMRRYLALAGAIS